MTEENGAGSSDPESQWDLPSAILNQVVMGVPIAVGTVAIARYKPWKLLYYLPGVVAFLTVWRRFICARCRYYGQECSTLLGLTTARMMPPDESKPLDRNAMIADFTLISLLSLLPLPQVFREFKLALLYVTSLASALASILLNACWRCGNRFCPMKDISRKISVQSSK